MAGPTVKEILLKWGIDNSNWKAAISDLSKLLEKSNRDFAKAQEQSLKRLEEQKAKLKAVIADQKSETAEIEKQIARLKVKAAASSASKADSVAKLAAEKAASAEADKQTAIQRQLQATQKALQQEVYTKLANEKLVTAEINRQNAALRLQIAQQRSAGGGGVGGRKPPGGQQGGGGFFGGLIGGLGSKFGGTLTSAVAMGELAADSIEGLIEKVKKFVEESGPLEQVREQFEKLSKIKGVDSVKFLEDMQKATHNLVGDIELYRTANKFMQSGIQTTAESMTSLMQATVGLARSQGRDATQAINALNMALSTGRFQRLAYITGLTREEMVVRGLTATMSSHQRIQLEYDNALKKITDRYRQFGEPALTATEVLKQLSVVTTRLFESFARGIVQSRGMAEVFKFLQSVIEELTSGEGGVEALGQKFGDVFIVIVEALRTLGSLASSAKDAFNTILAPFSGTVLENLMTFTGLLKTIAQTFVLIRTGAEIFGAATSAVFKSLAAQVKFYKGAATFDADKMRAALADNEAINKELEGKIFSAGKKGMDDLENLEAKFSGKQPTTKLGGEGAQDQTERNIALERQQEQLRLKSRELDAQLELSIEKGKLEQLKQANEEAYNAGLEALEDYIQKKKAYRQVELEDTLHEIAQEREAKLAELEEKSKTEFMDPKSLAMSRANIEKETAKKEVDARNAAQRELDALDMKVTVDKIAARRKLTDAIDSIEKAQIERTRQNTEYEFQQGVISAQQYLDKRLQFVEEDYEATKTAEEKKLAENKFSEAAKAEFASKMAKAAEDREKALTTLELSEIDIRTKAVEQSYDRAQKLIESQIQYQQSVSKDTYFGGGRAETRSLIEEQISLLKSRLEEEAKSLSLTQKGSQAWFQQLEKIQQTKQELVKYNEELVRTHDLSTQIASAVKELSQAAGKFPKGGRVAAGLETLAGGLEETAQIRQRQAQRQAVAAARAAGQKIAPVTPEEIFASLQKASKDAGDQLQSHLKSASESVEEWRQKLLESTDALDVLIQKATGRSPSGGGPSGPSTAALPLGTTTASDLMALTPAALTGGGSAGAGAASQQASVGLSLLAQTAKLLQSGFKNLLDTSLGNDGLVGYFKNLGKNTQQASDDLSNFADSVSSIAGNVGGLVSAAKGTGGPFQAGMQGLQAGAGLGGSIGSAFGPLGQAIGQGIGAGVGLAVGIFSGKAKKEAEKIAKSITAQFNAVLVEVQQGTLGLGSAVTEEINIIQSAVSQLSTKKGGRDELKNILPQMEQQLAQLQAQQQQIIKSFDKQLEIAAAPEASQALVQPIQQIIDTYQQYVLAGGNVTLANQYLQDSFRNLVTQGLDQLNQAEQDAVQNALNYNDLLLQRQELIQNTNQQIQDIMSQGVAVRQMPEGVTKARELQQVMLNAQNQQAQLDQEIAVSQHKLSNESKIFQLATTRVGLETQLVALQDAQLDKNDAATAALLQEVTAFSTATPGNLPTALGMLGLGGQYISPAQEPGLMPTPPVPTGIPWIDQQNQLQYQQALAYYNEQAGLSTSTTLPALGITGPGGTMGVTPAGTAATTTSSAGATLDAMASNIAAFPQAMQDMFNSADTIVNVGGALLTGIAAALGAPTTTSSGLPITPKQAPASTGSSLVRAGVFSSSMADVATQTNDLVSAASQRHVIEQNISDLSSTRVQQETQLVKLKMQEISADMDRVNAWSQLISRGPMVAAGSSPTLEDLLQSVYQTRARQGYGGFAGETSNPL